jgi:uncharacterized protein YcgI (DUF1989 family)
MAETLLDFVMEPGTGRAIELRKGQVLRIEQIKGGQCVDFNCFNLHDYREFMHTGRTRTEHGINPGPGDFMWSAPPRERPMIYILADTVHCNDVMYPRCSPFLFENTFGFHTHTNCHDIQSEAQREYGLTPDDVHDSFNLFMNTGVDAAGKLFIKRQRSKPGDHVELLALIDVLAVPNVCGTDVMRTSNFSMKPVRISVRTATAAELAKAPERKRLPSQRTVADFKVKAIRAERELSRDPSYRPEFVNVPIQIKDVDVVLDASDYRLLQALKSTRVYGDTDADVLRDIVFSWWSEVFLGVPDIPE